MTSRNLSRSLLADVSRDVDIVDECGSPNSGVICVASSLHDATKSGDTHPTDDGGFRRRDEG